MGFERPQTYALDRAAIGTGIFRDRFFKFMFAFALLKYLPASELDYTAYCLQSAVGFCLIVKTVTDYCTVYHLPVGLYNTLQMPCALLDVEIEFSCVT